MNVYFFMYLVSDFLAVRFSVSSGCLLTFCFHWFSFLSGSFVDSYQFVVILLLIFLIFFFLDKSL